MERRDGQRQRCSRSEAPCPNEASDGSVGFMIVETCCVLTRSGGGRAPLMSNALGLDGPLPSLPQASWNRPEPSNGAP